MISSARLRVCLATSRIRQPTDLLCRYGGDECAIATTRRADDAHVLASRIESQMVIQVDLGDRVRNVTASVGVAGGRRTEGRKDTHAQAAVEDLLVLASRESTAVKKTKGTTTATAVSSSPQAVGPRLRLVNVDVRTSRGRGARPR